jgi:hypothetical protein
VQSAAQAQLLIYVLANKKYLFTKVIQYTMTNVRSLIKLPVQNLMLRIVQKQSLPFYYRQNKEDIHHNDNRSF